MVYLISAQKQFYVHPTDITLGDKVFSRITSHDMRDFVDNDGQRKTVNYLVSDSSNYVVYLQHNNNKIIREEERYLEPNAMELGGRMYSNVVSRLAVPGKPEIYSVYAPGGKTNTIRVRPNGAVTDVGELKKQIIKRKLTQPFIRLAKLFRK